MSEAAAAVNFEEQTLGDAPEPARLIVGRYEAKCSEIKLDKSSKKHTPYLQFGFSILSIKDSYDEDDLEEAGGEKEMLNKIVYTTEYWLSEKARFNFKKFLAGLKMDGVSYEDLQGKNLKEIQTELQSKMIDEVFEIFVRRESLTDTNNQPLVDEEGEPITKAVATRVIHEG